MYYCERKREIKTGEAWDRGYPLLTPTHAHRVFSCFCSSFLFSGERSANRSAESLHISVQDGQGEVRYRLSIPRLLLSGQDDYCNMQIYCSCFSHLNHAAQWSLKSHFFLSNNPLLSSSTKPACCTLAGKAKQSLVLQVTALI